MAAAHSLPRMRRLTMYSQMLTMSPASSLPRITRVQLILTLTFVEGMPRSFGTELYTTDTKKAP